jgi:hypothetical protein
MIVGLIIIMIKATLELRGLFFRIQRLIKWENDYTNITP